MGIFSLSSLSFAGGCDISISCQKIVVYTLLELGIVACLAGS